MWEEETLGAKFHDVEIPANLKDEALKYHQNLIEGGQSSRTMTQ